MPRYSTIGATLPRSAGVYLARFTPTGALYVGSSINMHKRCTAHLASLKAGTHANSHLQALWNAHSAPAIVFDILWQPVGDVHRRELQRKEQEYIERYKAAAVNIHPAFAKEQIEPDRYISDHLLDLFPAPFSFE